MQDPLVTLGLIVLALLCLGVSVSSLGRWLGRWTIPGAGLETITLWTCLAVGIVLFFWRAFRWHGGWNPLDSHVDGLLLIVAIFAAMVLYLRRPGFLPGLEPFAIPTLAILLAWGFCASLWTFRAFDIHSAWKVLHVLLSYMGGAVLFLAGICGLLFLLAHHRLRRKTLNPNQPRLASLEAIERVIVRASALGFALLSAVMLMGLVEATSGRSRLGPNWWTSPKIMLAIAAWMVYGLLMNVRQTNFRGRRAAWLSIAGMVLMLAIFALAVSPTPGSSASPSYPAKEMP